jgi:hypothetical protein
MCVAYVQCAALGKTMGSAKGPFRKMCAMSLEKNVFQKMCLPVAQKFEQQVTCVISSAAAILAATHISK